MEDDARRLNICIAKIFIGLIDTGFTSVFSLEDYFWDDLDGNMYSLKFEDRIFLREMIREHLNEVRDCIDENLTKYAGNPNKYVKDARKF